MKGLIKIIIALLFFVATIYLLTYSSWLSATIKMIKGGIVLGVFFIGLILLLLGFSELRD